MPLDSCFEVTGPAVVNQYGIEKSKRKMINKSLICSIGSSYDVCSQFTLPDVHLRAAVELQNGLDPSFIIDNKAPILPKEQFDTAFRTA